MIRVKDKRWVYYVSTNKEHKLCVFQIIGRNLKLEEKLFYIHPLLLLNSNKRPRVYVVKHPPEDTRKFPKLFL